MSQTTRSNGDLDEERLEKLAAIQEELEIIVESDADYARYAENFLDRLEEAGYDV